MKKGTPESALFSPWAVSLRRSIVDRIATRCAGALLSRREGVVAHFLTRRDRTLGNRGQIDVVVSEHCFVPAVIQVSVRRSDTFNR